MANNEAFPKRPESVLAMTKRNIPPKPIRMLAQGEYPREHYNADHSPKRGFKTYEAAMRSAKTIDRMFDEKMYAYKCKYCFRYHIGHHKE